MYSTSPSPLDNPIQLLKHNSIMQQLKWFIILSYQRKHFVFYFTSIYDQIRHSSTVYSITNIANWNWGAEVL